ncbi:MAG: hypothetical protein PHW04_01980 [Candidatus Wallbacteria bacterium]|nr:hypothetical protein [Candidatus Wallbacteria bacterium]
MVFNKVRWMIPVIVFLLILSALTYFAVGYRQNTLSFIPDNYLFLCGGGNLSIALENFTASDFLNFLPADYQSLLLAAKPYSSLFPSEFACCRLKNGLLMAVDAGNKVKLLEFYFSRASQSGKISDYLICSFNYKKYRLFELTDSGQRTLVFTFVESAILAGNNRDSVLSALDAYDGILKPVSRSLSTPFFTRLLKKDPFFFLFNQAVIPKTSSGNISYQSLFAFFDPLQLKFSFFPRSTSRSPYQFTRDAIEQMVADGRLESEGDPGSRKLILNLASLFNFSSQSLPDFLKLTFFCVDDGSRIFGSNSLLSFETLRQTPPTEPFHLVIEPTFLGLLPLLSNFITIPEYLKPVLEYLKKISEFKLALSGSSQPEFLELKLTILKK